MTLPLKNPCHELYAQERALGKSPREACRAVFAQFGKFKPETGAGTKLENNAAIQARLKALRELDDELTAAKRERIERRLALSAEFNILDFADIDQVTKKPVIDWQKLKDSDYSIAVSEFSFDGETGVLTRFKRDDPQQAVAQLRDMHGFKSPTKLASTDPSGKKSSPLAMLLMEIDGTTKGLPAEAKNEG